MVATVPTLSKNGGVFMEDLSIILFLILMIIIYIKK